MRQLAWPPFTWLATAQPQLQHIHHNQHQSTAHLPQIISLRGPCASYILNPLRQSLQRLSTVQPTEVCYMTLFLFFRLKIPNWTILELGKRSHTSVLSGARSLRWLGVEAASETLVRFMRWPPVLIRALGEKTLLLGCQRYQTSFIHSSTSSIQSMTLILCIVQCRKRLCLRYMPVILPGGTILPVLVLSQSDTIFG